MFIDDRTSAERYAPDLLADPAMVRVTRALRLLCAISLGLPFGAGWAITGSLYGGRTAFLWAGLIRVALQHVTWSVNSLCHMIGSRPFKTRRHDRSTNLWPPALLSLGKAGTTATTANPTARGTTCAAARSTPPRHRSGCSNGWAGPPTCTGLIRCRHVRAPAGD
ncbi:hypothetical protein [Nonomuraea endophytica]|uniref:hypothetical protein n=1 Tax=Nonomuraea endophytica TaxID=714136 RepID=UPI0037C8F770